ncbi:hypothetical protein GCM10007916_12630 [Psychromonas marina]|uniref:DUF2569 family protein n=1 Tax=Psychromonas marina TaxID=88364 RepID=A0ABQ6DZL3_9GAMM|nr:hypothetical protein [Psychromonas marina]GLS90196.1 hypothetical protein GCM10007916_12630 [Psychromonas marina]
MLHLLGKKNVLLTSFILMLIMFSIVMFFINPQIDGINGMGVIKLQLSFDKDIGIEIIESWGESGIAHFKRWIFVDYIYAASYSAFFASLLSLLIVQKGKTKSLKYTWVVVLAFAACVFDWVENTMELLFLYNPSAFPDSLFFLHSVIAALKWAAVPIAVVYVIALMTKKSKIHAN